MEDKATLPSAVQPSYHGIIVSANDGMVLVEACLRGDIGLVSRRPIKEERAQLPRRGNIFIYEERDTGIVRWLDGITWTRDRKSDHCFLYRQLTPTTQKGAVELKPSPTSKEATRSSQDHISEATNTKSNDELFPMDYDTARHDTLPQPKADLEKSAIGLLMSDGDFVDDQLLKKTMRFKIGPQTYHLVSYYSAGDEVGKGKLQIPSKDPKLSTLRIRREISEKIYGIPAGDDSRDFKADELSADMSYPRSPHNRMGDAGIPALNTNSMGDADTPALDEYDSMGDAGLPALDDDKPEFDDDKLAFDDSMLAFDDDKPEFNDDKLAFDDGMLGFDAYNPMGDASIPAFDSYNPMGNAIMPAFDAYNPMGYASMPALGYDMRPGNCEDQDFEMPSTFSQTPDPNSDRAPEQASFQQGPYPPTNPYM